MFLLRDVFDYPYDRIAAIVGKSEAATRQIATRARRHVDDRRPRYEASERRREELAERFFAAAREGELESLESLLAEDVALHGDGGGRAPALARALYGKRRVAKTLAGWIELGRRSGGRRGSARRGQRSARRGGHGHGRRPDRRLVARHRRGPGAVDPLGGQPRQARPSGTGERASRR